MSKFSDSEWKNGSAADIFTGAADHFIPDRHRVRSIISSMYAFYILKRKGGKVPRVCELGCGDGFMSSGIIEKYSNTACVLVDGSFSMLEKAKQRFSGNSNISYVHNTFQEILEKGLVSAPFDFVLSSLAIHHLSADEKSRLYALVYKNMFAGGCFCNFDVTVNPDKIEAWYLRLWREWIIGTGTNAPGETDYSLIPDQYKNNPDNLPDTLKDQLEMLRIAGFSQPECYYKFGLFALFGGMK